MGRYLAIDYGSKRCGIAVSDPMKMIASGLETVASHSLMTFLETYFQKEAVECLVVGKPLQHDNRPSESYILVERFVNAFRKRFPGIEVAWEDERFTSKMAVQAMVEGGLKKSERRKRENVDKMSAVMILRSYMDAQNKKN
ncbi:MAG: Holliday junction resolvase RuvX [Bacteroidales bacterium]|nr:Holliday junction resolvase RuvX [Bacteroidales bacterium]